MADAVRKNPGALDALAGKLEGIRTLKVGFLRGGTYPDGTSLPMVAAANEFGGTIEREPSDPDEGGGQTIYRKVNKAGTEFLRGGRFVKQKESNFASTHYVGAYVIKRPPRPFFRNMIAAQAPKWGKLAAAILKRNDMDVDAMLETMGQEIVGRLQESINTLMEPPLAASTIARKGFDKPLIETSLMVKHIQYEVTRT